jgi:hypothetical protein
MCRACKQLDVKVLTHIHAVLDRSVHKQRRAQGFNATPFLTTQNRLCGSLNKTGVKDAVLLYVEFGYLEALNELIRRKSTAGMSENMEVDSGKFLGRDFQTVKHLGK